MENSPSPTGVTRTSFWFSFPFTAPMGMPMFANLFGWGCGYVAVYKGHPYWGMSAEEVPVDVHGGLTYSNVLTSWIENSGGGDSIARSYGSGFDKMLTDDWWVFGFDACHAGDEDWTMIMVHDEARELQKQLDILRARDGT